MKSIFEFLRPILIAFALSLIFAPILYGEEDSGDDLIPERNQFDFWVGEWELTWSDGGRGSNTITREYDAWVIREQFDGGETGFRGMSVSVYDTITGKWHQTWVDNSGNYFDFVGSFRDGVMDLRTERLIDGEPVPYRMIWYNISADSLDWSWQKSGDGGENWQNLWKIHYVRRK
jgi:hypothetical protein